MLSTIVLGVFLILLAYLLGSIPTGYLVGKYLRGIDIREHGSGSTGATNVLRTLGKKAGISVLIIDMLKGMLGIALVKALYLNSANPLPPDWQAWLILATGLAAVIGHSKSIFLNFDGGKSVATSLGVLLMMSPWVALATLGSFLLVLAISRIVSLSSITGAIAVIILMLVLKQPLPYILFASVAGLYVIIRHRGNIERLLSGTEPRLGQKLESLNSEQ
jgi:glycerol-3-phosphate acyltransferase PlsY